MKLTPEERSEIRSAVIDMALADQDDRSVELHADRVVFWLENREAIKSGDF